MNIPLASASSPGLSSVNECSAPEAMYLETLKEWKTARGLLATTIRRYLDACLVLETVYCQPLHITNRAPVRQTLEDISMEPLSISSYQKMLQRAQKAMCLARNRSPKLVPVNALPPEILTHIFNLVVISEFCGFYTSNPHATSTPDPPVHPGIMTQVCSHWHRLIINTPVLWARVDLVLSGPCEEEFHARARHLIQRAVGTPLVIRIHEPRPSEPHKISRLVDLLRPLSGQMGSLDMLRREISPHLFRSVLNCWFEHGNPGTVKELALGCIGSTLPNFLEPTSSPTPTPGQFTLSPQRFEQFFEPITALRLHGIFPRWNSSAYHGLIDLRLTSSKEFAISEIQLLGILTASPGLRSLYFDLNITDTQPPDAPPTPVRLNDLAILNLGWLKFTRIDSVLRLLAPGTRPLRLVISFDQEQHTPTFTAEAQSFFQRSNITTLFIGGEYARALHWFPYSLGCLPNLHALALQDQSYLDHASNDLTNDGDLKHVCSSLRELCMLNCKLDLKAFKELLSAHSVQVLRIWDCKIYSEIPDFSLGEELSGLVPDVRCYNGGSYVGSHEDPYLNWGFAYLSELDDS
jgi:hypothetical protein